MSHLHRSLVELNSIGHQSLTQSLGGCWQHAIHLDGLKFPGWTGMVHGLRSSLLRWIERRCYISKMFEVWPFCCWGSSNQLFFSLDVSDWWQAGGKFQHGLIDFFVPKILGMLPLVSNDPTNLFGRSQLVPFHSGPKSVAFRTSWERSLMPRSWTMALVAISDMGMQWLEATWMTVEHVFA